MKDLRRVASNLNAKQRAKALDKMHVTKMTQGMMGILVAFAFDDTQAVRAAAFLLAQAARLIGMQRAPLIELLGHALDVVEQDNPMPTTPENDDDLAAAVEGDDRPKLIVQ